MSQRESPKRECAICGKSFGAREVIPGTAVRDVVMREILRDHPDFSPHGFICRPDLKGNREAHVTDVTRVGTGTRAINEKEVLHSLRSHELLAKNVEAEMETDWSLGERMADHIATFGGSWTFLSCFGAFLVLWIAMNTVVLTARPVDPYPFILLNLVLSCLAAIQAPIIMMSQNRQESKDRLRSQHDYQVNLKAELEIRHLHDKMDHLLSHQWERLAEIQEIQLELLSELARRR